MTTPLPVRPYLIEQYTRTVCPACFTERQRASSEADVFKDGMLVSRDGRIYMRRFCGAHGETESLYEEDAEIWRARAGWSTPTLQVIPDRPDNAGGGLGAYARGLPASHGQHTCILLLNITERCNYGCGTCYAAARAPGSPKPANEHPSVDDIEHTVKTVLAREGGRLGVVMLSGGEPTVRDDLDQILERLAPLPVTRILINTNGRRILRDDRFLALLQKLRKRIEVYLQFDGLRDETYRALRDEALADEKRRTLKRLDDARIFTTLVTTVQRGVNDDEVGALIRLGLDTPYCAGLAIQPAFSSGRGPSFDPQDRVTPTGVLRRLADQSEGQVEWSDFIPLPCSHPDCCDITYMLQADDGSWRSLPKLLGRDELQRWIHLVSNTITFDAATADIKQMLESGALARVFSEQQKTSTMALADDICDLCACVPGLLGMLGGVWRRVVHGEDATEQVAKRIFRITCKMFMDTHTFHEARLRQCCVHTGTYEEDPRRYSFCWRWLFADANERGGVLAAEALGAP